MDPFFSWIYALRDGEKYAIKFKEIMFIVFMLQRAKKVVSDSPGLVDFAIRLVNSVINLPDRQVKFFEEFKLQKYCQINLLIKTFFGLVEMMFGLVNVSLSLPKWQAVKNDFLCTLMLWAICMYVM